MTAEQTPSVEATQAARINVVMLKPDVSLRLNFQLSRDNTEVDVWLGSGAENTRLGLGKHHILAPQPRCNCLEHHLKKYLLLSPQTQLVSDLSLSLGSHLAKVQQHPLVLLKRNCS